MDRDDFIITVYCLVCEHYAILRAAYGVRHGGFAPALTDEEVITMEMCGEYFKCRTDKDLYGYFRAHYRHFFPCLTDRTLFVRQAANLWAVKAAIQRRLTVVSAKPWPRSRSLTRCRCRSVGIPAAPGIDASNPTPIMATVRRRTFITMALSWVCGSAATA